MPDYPSRPDEVVAVLETLVDQIRVAIEQLRAMRPGQGDDKPPAPSAHPDPWLRCSKAQLLRALGRSRTNVGYLDVLQRDGVLELRKLDAQHGNLRYQARFTDPAKHAEIRRLIREWTCSYIDV